MVFRIINRQVKIAAIRLYERDLLDLDDILDCCGFSRRTWFRILKLWRETGDVVPEARSIRGRLRLLDQEDIGYLLELINGNPDYFLDELLNLLKTNRFISVHFATIFRELERLNVSRKKLKKIALERDEERRGDFIARMAQYSPEEIGFLDEMSKDALSALLTMDGIVAGTVVEGSMTRELFLEFLEFNVVRSAYTILD
ncbi:hypothetical protein BDN70DRAFT_817158 [Pholiota conissans]|uniref:Uncharacterized protein n=1 Tax=Pholiota conissans TaxID=109636 RepID=A0A9P5YPC5_9AGAR|nr:hypothetical protein BDN70DRAFT_817158 [Pholiota conissans]